MLEDNSLRILGLALEELEAGFSSMPRVKGNEFDPQDVQNVLLEVARRLQDNFPYFHPLYAGQMLKPPHAVARLAYALAMWINPNNHALDGGKASSAMEKEAVAEIAGMVGWTSFLGHLCSGGMMANLEALWIAGQVRPNQSIVASDQAHYTHNRTCSVLRLPFESIPCSPNGRLDVLALEQRLEKGGVGTVVATIGTTGTGSVDPLPQLLDLRKRYDFRIHADAAYGGYFLLADNLAAETQAVYECLAEVDSIVIDPHKHGLQPYGCGCVLFRDPTVGRFYKHDSPYTYFTSKELHLGEISLECSRPGAAAVGLWATQRLLPLVKKGRFAAMLQSSRSAALSLYGKLKADGRFMVGSEPELDIVVWALKVPRVSEASKYARLLFEEAARRNLHLALAEFPVEFFNLAGVHMERDQQKITCLRSVLMKPEHSDWVDRIWEIVSVAADSALSQQ